MIAWIAISVLVASTLIVSFLEWRDERRRWR